jgi:hypothetical protein
MTIQYKSDTFDLTTTNLTTVLTINASSIAIVKTVQVSVIDNSNVGTDLFLRKSGGSDVIIAHNELNKETVNIVIPVEFRGRRCYKNASRYI